MPFADVEVSLHLLGLLSSASVQVGTYLRSPSWTYFTLFLTCPFVLISRLSILH